MKLCTRCRRRRSVIKLNYLGESLCKECFLRYFEEQVMRVLKGTGLLSRLSGKLVVVATSGGKDSSNALYILKELSESYDYEVAALLVNEGIKGYREHKAKALRALCTRLGVNLIEVSMKKEMGVTIDQVALLHERGKLRLKPCSVCGVFRRYLMNIYAKEVGAEYVATGHNLDDEVQTFIMNIIRGDLQSIVREGPVTRPHIGELIPRFKPLYYLTEKESMLHFILRGLETPYVECPYAKLSMRYQLRTMINSLEQHSPGTKHRLLRVKESLRKKLGQQIIQQRLRRCSLCGMPTSHDICRACEIKIELERIIKA